MLKTIFGLPRFIWKWIVEVKEELSMMEWLPPRTVFTYTILVIVFAILIALGITLFDAILVFGRNLILTVNI